MKFGKKKFVYSSGNQEKSRSSLKSQMNDPKARSKLISGPTDFKHVHHMGPESNVQNLIADPTPVKEFRYDSKLRHYHYVITNEVFIGSDRYVITSEGLIDNNDYVIQNVTDKRRAVNQT